MGAQKKIRKQKNMKLFRGTSAGFKKKAPGDTKGGDKSFWSPRAWNHVKGTKTGANKNKTS